MSSWRALRAVVTAAAFALAMIVAGSATGGSADDTTPVSRVPHVHVGITASDPVKTFAGPNIGLLVPGDSAAGLVTLANLDTRPLRYHIDATATDDDGKGLGGAFLVRVTEGSDTATDGSGTVCSGESLIDAGRRFAGHLLATPERQRLLGPGDSTTLCIQAQLPSSLPTTMQGAVTEVKLTVIGTT